MKRPSRLLQKSDVFFFVVNLQNPLFKAGFSLGPAVDAE